MTGALSFSAVARAANVTRRTLYAWQADGRFPVEPIAGSKPPRYSATEVAAWLKAPVNDLFNVKAAD